LAPPRHGAFVYGGGSALTLTDVEVIGGTGDGLRVEAGGTLSMSGGSICGCSQVREHSCAVERCGAHVAISLPCYGPLTAASAAAFSRGWSCRAAALLPRWRM